MTIYYQDETVTLLHGDAHQMLTTMDSGSVGCIITSPPYYNLRDYGEDGQLGTEDTATEYITALTNVFNEAHRVLADDGTLWLNLGDSYGADKNLMMIPARVALAVQDSGWILRNDVIWHKPKTMPESVMDRLSRRHEHVFMFTKYQRYWFDLDPIRETPKQDGGLTWGERKAVGFVNTPRAGTRLGSSAKKDTRLASHGAGPNPGDVWSIVTETFPGAHFAVFPLALAERCLLAGAKPGTTVLDPFSGSGTTGMAAAKHGRRYVGIDLNKTYLDLSLTTRLAQPGLDLEGTLA